MSISAPQYAFGSGVMFGRRIGAAYPTPTPTRFGALQDCSIDMSFTNKQLYGQYQFPLALGRGTAKITGKAKFAQLNAQAFNDLFFGQSAVNAGSVVTVPGESAVITANIVTAAHNTTYLRDQGVVNATTGEVIQRVSSAPVGTANYSVNESTGVYTFNNSYNGSTVLISYQWTDTGNGSNIVIANQLLGSAPQFMITLTEVFNSNKLTLTLNACMSNKLTMSSKLEDFWVQDFDFEAYADGSNNLGTLSLEAL